MELSTAKVKSQPEDEGTMILRTSETTYPTTWNHNTEDFKFYDPHSSSFMNVHVD